MVKVTQTALNNGLLSAAASGDLQAVRRSLDHGAQPDARTEWGEPALVLAADGNHVSVVKELITRGVDVDAQRAGGETALMTATTRGNLGIVKDLLKAGASTAAQNHWGNTALHLAAIYDRTEIARALLEAGASMTAVNKEGYDARGLAQKNRQVDFLNLLDAAEQSRFSEDLKDFSDGLDRDVTVKNPVHIKKPSTPPKRSFHHMHRGR